MPLKLYAENFVAPDGLSRNSRIGIIDNAVGTTTIHVKTARRPYTEPNKEACCDCGGIKVWHVEEDSV